MHRALVPAAVAGALLLAGCGSGQASSAGDFQGAEGDVAEVVDELASAGRSNDAAKICGELFSRALADSFQRPGCVEEMTDAADDADDFELDVRDVTVTGNTARAVVASDTEGGRTATFEFTRERGAWRASSLSGG